jgi:hypothetical protein
MKLQTFSRQNLPRRVRRMLTRFVLPLSFGLASLAAMAGGPTDRLTLLLPDGADVNSWQVKVWTDSAAEEGIRLDTISDSALQALGTTAAAKIAGLIVPDSAHIRASDAVIAAVKQYAYLGGKLMLVYDAGALTDTGFYPLAGNSRFADMTGVDYLFYNSGRGADTMVGFGPVAGTRARLDSLLIPPGKYMPYVPPTTLASTTANSTAFVPTSRFDPGGTQAMTELIVQRARKLQDESSRNVRLKRGSFSSGLWNLGIEATGPLRFDRRNTRATNARDMHILDRVKPAPDAVAATLSTSTSVAIEASTAVAAAVDTSLQVISGYAFGPLGYFHYVTTGTFPGTVYLSSPEHGLVAGSRSYGNGQLLFVNMPLGYFKAVGTDSAPLHGFLSLFARDQVGISKMSVQPRGVGGLIYNWHVDDRDDLMVDMKYLLDKTRVLDRGPFSFHFTAGPDVITFGDGMGMDLNNNKPGQDLVRRIGSLGKYAKGGKASASDHALGSHGGWIHDYWSETANESNVPDLTKLLTDNFGAIERAAGSPLREYSSPGGNTPLWAVRWLEQRGVVGSYFTGDIGAGMVRSWREGARVADKLWSAPVTPLGKYATFEEFEEFGISDAESGQWLLDLQSFVINHRTNRLFYNHPPGAVAHLNPLNALLDRADKLEKNKQFRWYSIAQLADFSQRRVETNWSSSTVAGITTFSASHPASLQDITWLLPKNRYTAPVISQGTGSLSSDSQDWIVSANGGTSLKFISRAL